MTERRARGNGVWRAGRGLLALLVLGAILGAGRAAAQTPAGGAAELTDLLTEGKAALEDGWSDLAQKQLQGFIAGATRDGARDPRVPEALVLLMRALYAQKNYGLILETLGSAQLWEKRGVKGDCLAFWRALALHELAEADKALSELNQFETSFPDSEYAARVLRIRAWCHLELGGTDDALAAFARFDELYPDAPEAAQNLLEWGRTLVATERLPEARSVLERLVSRPAPSPFAMEGRYWLGQVLVQSREPAAAVVVLRALADDDGAPGDLRAQAWLALAVAFDAQGSQDETIAALKQGLEIARDPGIRRTGQFDLGRLLLELGRLDEGIPILKDLIAGAPDDELASTAQLRVAEALLSNGRYEEAIDEYQHHVETFAEASGQARAYRGKGLALLKVGRNAEAATAFTRAHGLVEDPVQKEECLFKVGDACFANAQYKLAAETYARVLSEYPESELAESARFQLGNSLALGGDPVGAETEFRALIEKHPNGKLTEEALLRLAEVKEMQGRWLEAIDAFNRVLNVYTNSALIAEVLHGRGDVYYRLLRFGEAAVDFERVLQDFPESEVAEQAEFKRGMCYYWMGRDEEAVTTCRGFIERHPESSWAPELLFWLGKYEYNKGDYEGAEATFLTFVERHPRHSLADDSLLRAGLAALRQNQYVRSVEQLTRLVKDYPQSPKIGEARFAQADALIQLARYGAAILILDEIINKCPDSDLVAPSWGRKGDCQFTLGADDPKRYEESIESYRVVVNSAKASLDLVMQAEYKIGRSYEKLGDASRALEQYYRNVVLKYFEDRDKGIWHSEAAKVWFSRAARDAAAILEAKKEWRKLLRLLERVVQAGVPASDGAAQRIERIRAERWLPFWGDGE